MNDFRKTLDYYDLRDLGYFGFSFTWCNNREGGNKIFERLDRFLANSSWCEMFLLGSVRHDHATYSDHCPIILDNLGTRTIRSSLNFSDLWPCG